MDPASLAVGVLPLAINIVQMSSAVRQKVANYKSAPADIQNILERTDLIGQVCSRLEAKLRAPGAHHETAILEQALKKCYTSVSGVNRDLEKVTSQKGGRRRSMQYVFSKFHVDRSLSDLNDSITMLTTCMTLSTCINLDLIASPSFLLNTHATEDASFQHGTDTKPPAIIPKPAITHVSQKQSKTVEMWRKSCRNFLFLFENVTTSVTDQSGREQSTYRSYLVGSPLLGTFVSLAMRYGPLSPFSLALDTPRFIYEKNDAVLFHAILDSAPGKGATAEDVGRWVTRFKITPTTQLVEARDDDRSSILGWLAAYNKLESFKCLVECGDLQQLGNTLHMSSVLPWHRGFQRDRQLLFELYIDLRGPLLTVQEYGQMLIPLIRPLDLLGLFNCCKDIFFDQQREFFSVTLFTLIHKLQYRRHRPLDEKSWALCISQLLDAGLDLHQVDDVTGYTALSAILMDEFTTHLEALEWAEKWIKILECASVDVEKYLYVELIMLLEEIRPGVEPPEELLAQDITPWPLMDVRTKLDIMHDICIPGLRVPVFANEDSTDDLLQIVPAFRYDWAYLLCPPHTGSFSHIDWKKDRLAEGDYADPYWPFLKETRSTDSIYRASNHLNEETEASLASHDLFLDLMHTRFERRQMKKWEKTKKVSGMMRREEKMPGSWDMEWWEYEGPW